MDPSESQPTDAQRREAVCAALVHAPGLLRYAARFSRTLQDAEDAYQRALEIALTRAPVVEHERFMAWLRTVLRNEALTLSARRGREGPAAGEDAAEAAAREPSRSGDPHALVEWRHRYHALGDALAEVTEAQRICLILQAGGASYAAIVQATGFSRRKVERSILEGRQALWAWEDRAARGEMCERLRPALQRVAEGAADRSERRRVARHVRHCGACRAALRDRRATDDWMAALAPVCLLGGVAQAAPPDPTPTLAWVERLSAGATVRLGNALQIALETPGSVAAKAGAAAAAAVVALGAAGPAIADLVRGAERPASAPPVAVARPTPPAASAPAVPPPVVTTTTSARAPGAVRPDERPPAPAAPTRLVPPSALRHVGRAPTAAVDARPPLRRPPAVATARPAASTATPAGRAHAPRRPAPAVPPDLAGPRGISIGPSGP